MTADAGAYWEGLEAWGTEPELNPLEAMMWRTERPPAGSWAGVVVQLLDGTPEWERVVRAHEGAALAVPRFTERVVEPVVPIGPPVWSRDEHFDLAYHLRRAALPAPGSMRQLLDLAQVQGATPLDRNRPPWMAIFVEGLEGGRSAYVLQAHHVLMDGGGATQLFSRILGRAPDSPGVPPSPRPPASDVSSLDATVRGLVGQVRRTPGRALEFTRGLARASAAPLATAEYAASLARVASPPPRTDSPLLQTGPRTSWRFSVLECGFDELRAAGKAAGGTVNDTFVCAVLGGLRAYHRAHGLELGDVPISMPVSVRTDDDPMGGNRFTGAFFSAPSGTAEPAARIAAMRERVAAVRDELALDFLNSVTPLANLAPSGVLTATLGSLTSGAVLISSSWRGLTEPAYVAGALFERMFVFGPLPGTAMCAAMNTHLDVCCMGFNVDADVFPDGDVLDTALQQGLDELLALGRS